MQLVFTSVLAFYQSPLLDSYMSKVELGSRNALLRVVTLLLLLEVVA